MPFRDQILSEEDYEQLPPTLRRKYFSSLERLRFAHDASPSKTRSRPQSSRRPSTSHTLYTRSQSLPCVNQRNFPASTSRRTRLRKSFRPDYLNTPSLSLTPQEFTALPPTVRRKYFSLEEQYHIISRSTPVILDAVDEALYKRYLTQQYPTTPYLLVGVGENEEDWEDCGSDDETLEDMDIHDLETFRWLDDGHDLDLKLDDYHAISQHINTSNNSPASTNRRHFKRGLSFSNISIRRRSSSSTSVPIPNSHTNNNVSLPSAVQTQHKHLSKDSLASLDPAATHYQDPAAKMKLRVYLASPQKFDEALEFGFPSLCNDAVQVVGRPRTSPAESSGQTKTFFSDDTPSLSEDNQEDETSIYPGRDSPTTPIDVSFPPQRVSQKSSTDRSSHFRPRIVTESYAYASATEREMTLKMTLTRPELRNIEMDHTNTTDVNDRPLEKAPLTVPFSANQSIWDDLPEQPSRMKRFFQKFKSRT